jgi:hypothetical protein
MQGQKTTSLADINNGKPIYIYVFFFYIYLELVLIFRELFGFPINPFIII